MHHANAILLELVFRNAERIHRDRHRIERILRCAVTHIKEVHPVGGIIQQHGRHITLVSVHLDAGQSVAAEESVFVLVGDPCILQAYACFITERSVFIRHKERRRSYSRFA